MKINTKITPRWVTPESADGARFRIRPMNGQDRLELATQIEKRGERHIYPAAAQVQAIHSCLLDWDVTDEDGEPARLTLENVRQLDEMVLIDLFGEIQSDGRLQSGDGPEEDEPGN